MSDGRKLRFVPGGVTAPRGFRAAGISAGLKKKPGSADLALLLADVPCTAAGVFTRNRVKAHPVVDAAAKLRAGRPIRGILVNSGSANACTGPEGMGDLRRVLDGLAGVLDIPSRDLLMSSTGVIGDRLPVDKIVAALPALAAALSGDGGAAASRAIMTTDTRPKECAAVLGTSGGRVTIGGMAKGAGMINPDMATMLCFLTTDARIGDRRALVRILRDAADRTFNRLDLDSDTSTNDSVIVLAGGASGVDPLAADAGAFADALLAVCDNLSRQIAADTEGATRVMEIIVRGARTAGQARKAAVTVAESPLVKTAVHGQDPNWGRIMAALGRSGARFDPERVSLTVNGLPLVRRGKRNGKVSEEEARKAFAPPTVTMEIDLAAGPGEHSILSGDLTADYVRINASYRS